MSVIAGILAVVFPCCEREMNEMRETGIPQSPVLSHSWDNLRILESTRGVHRIAAGTKPRCTHPTSHFAIDLPSAEIHQDSVGARIYRNSFDASDRIGTNAGCGALGIHLPRAWFPL